MDPCQLDQKFHKIVEESLQGIAIYQDNRVVYANPAVERILGVPAGRLTQFTHEEIFHLLPPDRHDYFINNINQLVSGQKKTLREEMQISALTGELVWIEIDSNRIQYQGKPAVLVSLFDITQRKVYEENARQLAEEMKLANDFIMQVSQMNDIDQICRFLISTVHKLIPQAYGIVSLYNRVTGMLSIRASSGKGEDGLGLDDIIGQPLNRLPGRIYSMDKRSNNTRQFFFSGKLGKVSRGLYPLLGGILSRKLCNRIEQKLSIASVWTVGFSLEGQEALGGLILALPEGVRLDHYAAMESIGNYVAVLLHRISAEEALSESEVHFDVLFDYAADAMYMYSLEEGRFLVVNEGACTTWGYSKDRLMKMNLSDLIPDHALPHVLDMFQEISKEKQIIFETAYRHAKGELIPSDVHAQWIQYKNMRCVFAVNRDIRERKRNEKELLEGQQKYRELSIHLQNIREEQNSLIAKEIHDELGQSLTALKMHISLLAQDVESPSKISSVRSLIGDMKEIANTTINRVRKLSHELWPSILEVADIIEVLDNQVKEYKRYSGLKVHFESELTRVDLNKEKSLAVYRIVQEAFTNIFRHSGANQVKVRVYLKPGFFCVQIEDNGKGFVLSEKDKKMTFGILGMQERAKMFGGSLDIISREKKGTALFLALPL